jgi:CBS domain containing-hemolysin-like protein
MLLSILIFLLFAAISIYLVVLIRSFNSLPIKELKRQAQAGDELAKRVFPVRAHGIQLWFILYFTLSATALIAITSFSGALWIFIILAPLIASLAIIVPRTQRPSLHAAAVVSPVLERILRLFFPILRHVESAIVKLTHHPEPVHFVRSKEELLDVLAESTAHFDHAGKNELQIAANALTYGELVVSDYMTPLNAVTFLAESDSLTPVVLGELHDTGHSRFPVYRGNNQQIVGTLYLKDALNSKSPKPAKEVMRNDIYYINEQTNLDKALAAFIKTKHHLFIVVNEFEDVVGVITIEDVLEQIIGSPILDEFDQFDDLRAVAHQNAKAKREEASGEHVI